MPRRVGTNTRAWIYRFLCLRDGEHCALCFVRPTKPLSATLNEPISATRNSESAAVSATRNGQSRRHEITLEIDHVNGKHRDWSEENVRLLCKSCNVAESNRRRSSSDFSLSQKQRRRRQGNPATELVRNGIDFSLGPPQMQANNYYEPRFRNWILQKFEDGAEYLEEDDALNSGAEISGCSIATAVTYLRKLTSSEGPLMKGVDLFKRPIVMLKPELAKKDGE